ncbi:MAG TPA: cytochrome d ubiquinol oxidase subunit II [Polyangiales bacterium]|jgi:cytochrome d ubiquinol oxidase subunit II|nr:cytochrome d ubiquinol oxidase subunit II [Polyangiales bacterium]
MAEFVLATLLIALTMYAVLAGADFGAGMIEPFVGGSGSVDVALAPVWEANHVWLVLALVLAFVGFPNFYAIAADHLHLPLLFVLLGIVARGSAFTFRHYDPDPGALKHWYTAVFRVASLLTPLFLGITLAATAAGTFPSDPRAGFYAIYIAPWNTAFGWATGVFVCALFAFEGAALFAAEQALHGLPLPHAPVARFTHLLSIACGAIVFGIAYVQHLQWFAQALHSAGALVAFAIATAMIPLVARAFDRGRPWLLRIAMAVQVGCVLLGFFAGQFPILIRLDSGPLTYRAAAAPPATLHAMIWTLVIGLGLILPSLTYLIRVYKQPA